MSLNCQRILASIFIMLTNVAASSAADAEDTTEMEGVAYRFNIGDTKYTLGRISGGAQYGVFMLCRGPGRIPKWALDDIEQKNKKATDPRRALEWSDDDCVFQEYHGDGGSWLNSPDSRYFYLQDTNYMGHKSLYLVDVESLDVLSNLKTPAVNTEEIFGPDPALGEAAFDNSARFLGILTADKQLWIYDRVKYGKWVFRTSISGFHQLAAIQPVDNQRVLLCSDKGEVSLLDIDARVKRRIGTIPDFKMGSSSDSRFIIVSPNLTYAVFVNGQGAWLLHIPSGAVLASSLAATEWTPAVTCVENNHLFVEKVDTVLRRSPGRCGRTVVRDNGTAMIEGVDGSLRELRALR